MESTHPVEYPNNPTASERYSILKHILKQYNRLDDFPYIIKGTNPPSDVLTIAPTNSMKGMNVAVLGAGIAGLTAAFELRKLGADIDIFEASKDHIGGKVHTYYFDKYNYGELGPMRFPVGHNCIWHYIDLFKLNTRPFTMNNLNTLIYIKNIRVKNDPLGENVKNHIYPLFKLTPNEQQMSWQALLERGFMDPLLTLTPEIRQEILYQLYQYSPGMKYWLNQSVIETMFKMGISQGAINMLSSLSLILGGFSNSGFSEVFQENYTCDFEYLYQINGGSSMLSNAFYHSLLSPVREHYNMDTSDLGDVRFRMGDIVTGINYHNNRVSVKSRTDQGNTKSTYDYVVCCLPYSKVNILELDPLLTLNRAWGVSELYYQDIQKTLLYCNRRFWLDKPYNINGGGSITDLPIKTIWYPDDGVTDSNAKGVLLASYNLGLSANRIGTLDDKTAIELIKRQVELVHGLPTGYMDDIVIGYKRINWKTEEYYQGMCFYNTNQKYLFSPGTLAQEYNNRLFFSGVHVSTTHGWVQGAIQTSLEAVNKIAHQVMGSKM